MKSTIQRGLIAVGILLCVAGCSSGGGENLPATVDASGVVLLDGNPVEGASVVFAPVDPGKYPAFSITDSSGGFDLKAFEAKGGAVPGAYQVQVSKTVEVQVGTPPAADLGVDAAHAAKDPKAGVSWKNALPQKYASPATSELTIQIPASGKTDIKIEMVSKP